MTQSAQRAKYGRQVKAGKEQLGVIGWGLILVFIFQLAALCYFNFTQLRNHMGYDSSWNFLRSALMWQERAIISPNWSETTNLHLDTHMMLTSLLYGLTGNILLSFAIGNLLMVALLLLFLWKILGRLEVRWRARMIALNLLICPYLTTEFSLFNDLGYFSNILSGASYYTLRMLLALMIIYEFMRILQEGKIGLLAGVIWLGCLLCGFSSGVFMIVILLLPYLVYEIEMTAIRNEWRQLWAKESLFAYLCCGFVVLGKLLAMKLVHFVALDSSRTWTSLDHLWNNLGAVIQGFLKLLQVLPTVADDKPLMTVAGLARVFILVVFAILLIGAVTMAVKALKGKIKHHQELLFLVNLVLVNFLVFSLYNVQYGALIFEERYLIISFFAMAMLTAVFFDGLEERSVLSVLLSVAMAGSLFMVDVHSDYNYLRTTHDAWPMDEIAQLAEAQEAGVVYMWGEDLSEIRRVMRVSDLNRIYKEIPDEGGYFTHWGDYLTYDDNEEYTGPTLLICDSEKQLVPAGVLAEYTLVDTLDYEGVDTAGQLAVYASDHNPRLW